MTVSTLVSTLMPLFVSLSEREGWKERERETEGGREREENREREQLHCLFGGARIWQSKQRPLKSNTADFQIS